MPNDEKTFLFGSRYQASVEKSGAIAMPSNLETRITTADMKQLKAVLRGIKEAEEERDRYNSSDIRWAVNDLKIATAYRLLTCLIAEHLLREGAHE